MGASESQLKVIWKAQPGPQSHLIACPVDEVFFGGARGGGKTEASIGDWLQHASQYGQNATGVFFRRKFKQLEEVVARSKQLFPLVGAKYHEQRAEWVFNNGARLKFRYLERDSDAEEYQGHNYCVAVGTPVLMADGSWQAIETITPTQQVMTLQGPRTVLSKVEPYFAPCVRAQVHSAAGEVLAEQVHPIWHPLASSAGLSESHTGEIRQIDQLTAASKLVLCTQAEESPLYADPSSPGWLAWAKGDHSDYKAFEDELRASSLLRQLSFPAVLHAPSFHQVSESSNFSDGAREYPLAQQSEQGLLGKFQELPSEFQASGQSPLHERLGQGLGSLYSPNAAACALNEMRSAQGFLADYQYDPRFCDERALLSEESGLIAPPSQACAEKQHHERLPDALGTIPVHTQMPQLYLAHPYTGEVQHLSEEVVVAKVVLQPFGFSLVSDLEVAGANHYITFGGFVNKNTRVYVEEVTNFPSPAPINKLRATLRSPAGVPCGLRLTGNPGGPGHNWVKHRYIDPCPAGYKVLVETFDYPGVGEVKMERVFIPSKISDNRLLMENDPTYIARLHQSGSEQLVKAWLEGDWDMIDGAFFTEFDVDLHVLSTDDWLPKIPRSAVRFRAFDWGFAKPFSCGWYAVSDGNWGLPRGALVKYREWYGSVAPNEGVRMEAGLVARGIKLREQNEPIKYGAADPSIFIRDGGPSIAEMMAVERVQWRRADNKRIPGWQQLRHRLVGENGQPMIYFLDVCVDTVRTLPVLQHDERDLEDLDTEGEDHAGDETRYACMSRPYVPRAGEFAVSRLPRGPGQVTINELVARQRRQRLENSE